LTEAAQAVQRERVSDRMRRAARNASGDRGGAEAPAQPGRSARGGSAQEEREIARSLDRVAERLAAAGGERASAGRLAAELSRALDLRDRLASADRQLAEMRRDLESPQEQNRGRGRAAGAGGRGEQGQGQATSGEWERARELLEQLRREGDSGLSTRDLEGFNPGISAPGTEAWKQDFRRWDELSAKAAAALEKLERSAAARLREELSTDRLNAGATQAIPEQYRPLVAKYFEALAK
jgi:hypothetical protein